MLVHPRQGISSWSGLVSWASKVPSQRALARRCSPFQPALGELGLDLELRGRRVAGYGEDEVQADLRVLVDSVLDSPSPQAAVDFLRDNYLIYVA